MSRRKNIVVYSACPEALGRVAFITRTHGYTVETVQEPGDLLPAVKDCVHVVVVVRSTREFWGFTDPVAEVWPPLLELTDTAMKHLDRAEARASRESMADAMAALSRLTSFRRRSTKCNRAGTEG